MGFTTKAVHGALHSALAQVFQEFADDRRHRFAVRLWDGATIATCEEPRFTLVINHPRALRAMFGDPTQLSLGEAYIFGDFDVEGDMEAACDFGRFLLDHDDKKISLAQKLYLAGLLQGSSLLGWQPSDHRDREAEPRGSAHSKERDAQAVRYHYDLPPEFFALWLDRQMVYSCAYFATGKDGDLDAAQEQKLDYICRKLRLRPGDHLLDIGCGWGGLLIHAASRYGALAHGITLSIRQAEVARERIERAGLQNRCRVDVCDYRDIECDCQFDKIVSVGMFEHVGSAMLPKYFKRAWDLLRPGGVFLNHGIAASPAHQVQQGRSFIDRYVFPDGELVPLNQSLGFAERTGFEARDVESLREHYTLTLRHWVHRLEARADEARRITDETTYRIWRLYMAASAQEFRAGDLNLYQMLLAKPLEGESGLPLTRADWYAQSSSRRARLEIAA